MSDKKVKIDAELRQQLLGILPLKEDAILDYTPPFFDDIPKKYRPIFKLKQLSKQHVIEIKRAIARDMLDARRNIDDESIDIDVIEAKNKEYMKYLHKCLVGWDNLIEVSTGDTVEYDGEEKTMMLLPETIRISIFKQLLQMAGLSVSL